MSKKFYVRLTLYFLDGTVNETITDIVDVMALERKLKEASPVVGADSIIKMEYTTLKELPDDGEA